MISVHIPNNKYVYFTSDHHFGAPNNKDSLVREKLFLKWLDMITDNVSALFIVGDLFDFWFEYDYAVPKGYVRILGKLAQMRDSGIPIYFLVGNHDLWMRDYFEKELDIPVFHQPITLDVNHKKVYVAHGDGLGPGDKGYKYMKSVFVHPLSKWLFKWLHPDLGIRLGNYFSLKNKLISGKEDVHFLGEDNEWLIQYTKEMQSRHKYDYYIYGHRHLPMILPLENEKTVYANIGDWISYFSYLQLDTHGELSLHYFK